jgi:hypothetical protein
MTATPYVVSFDASSSTTQAAIQIALLGADAGTARCVTWVVGSKVYIAKVN